MGGWGGGGGGGGRGRGDGGDGGETVRFWTTGDLGDCFYGAWSLLIAAYR